MAARKAATAPEGARELIRDSQFGGGLILLEAKPGKRAVYGHLTGRNADSEPIWDLAQWSSKFPLAERPPEKLPNGTLRYENEAKAVTLGAPATEDADLVLAIKGNTEYGNRARKQGEPWVHLLVQQDIADPPALDQIASLRLRISARLCSSKLIKTPDYSPQIHAAQFQLFFTVQNRNRQSPGFGQYLWFGVPVYDDRQRIPKGHTAQDTGGTSMFIFTPGGETFTSDSAHDGKWITIEKDLAPLIRPGLETAWKAGFLKASQTLADYRIGSINMGWEVPGIFDVAMQVRDLSLTVR